MNISIPEDWKDGKRNEECMGDVCHHCGRMCRNHEGMNPLSYIVDNGHGEYRCCDSCLKTISFFYAKPQLKEEDIINICKSYLRQEELHRMILDSLESINNNMLYLKNKIDGNA